MTTSYLHAEKLIKLHTPLRILNADPNSDA